MNKNAKCSAWFRNLAIAAAVFPAAALCETNVTEDVVLTEDADWRAEGVATISATVNLNGHKLYTAGVAGSGMVMNASTNACYKFYKFKCDATGGNNFQVGEIQLLDGDTVITETPAAIHWDDSGYNYSSLGNTYVAEKAFDGITNNEWYDHRISSGKVWATVEYAEPVRVTGYKWWTGMDTSKMTDRNPVSWRLQASNDNESWIDLEVVVNDNSCPTANSTLAYTGVVSNQDANACELHIEVPAGETQTLNTFIAGPLKLVKDGAGTLVLSKSRQGYSRGVLVAEGILKPNVRGRYANLFGNGALTGGYVDITIENGAQFLDDIYCNGSLYNVNWTIAGDGPDGSGAIRTVARALKDVNNALVAWGSRLTLTDDAVINSEEYAFDFINDYYTTFYLELNGHTLNVTGKSSGRQYPFVLFSSVQSVGEGTLVMENLQFYPYRTAISQLVGTTVVIGEDASYYTDYGGDTRDVTISNLVYRSTAATAQMRQTTTVLGTYAPISTVCAPKVVLGDASHLSTVLDLSERTTPFDIALGGGLTFASGSTVTVKTGSNNSFGKILAWSAPPDGISFRTDVPGCVVEVRDDGLYLRLNYFYLRLAQSEETDFSICVPEEWLSGNGLFDGSETAAQIRSSLLENGANGIPVWQSWCLGLTHSNPSSVVLCVAASEQPAAGSVRIEAENVVVPAIHEGVEVKAFLDVKAPGGTWQEDVTGQTVDSGAVAFERAIDGAGISFFA